MVTDPRRVDPPDHLPSDADAALRDLYAQHGQALLAYAERFTADRGRAEDIVQETFLRAWRQLPRLLDDERPVRPWLLQVARRLLIDAARAARVRPILSQDTKAAKPAVDGGLDHRQARHRELELRPRDRRAVHRDPDRAARGLAAAAPPATARTRR